MHVGIHMQMVCILLMLIISTFKFSVLEKHMHHIRITGGEMSTPVCMYVQTVACVQVLFTDVYKSIYTPLVGANAEIHCSDLYVSI